MKLAPFSVPREKLEVVQMTFRAFLRRVMQINNTKKVSKHANEIAFSIMKEKNIRANAETRVGATPGVQIGDIFYYRVELCIVGLHAQTIAGIDCMTSKLGKDEDSIAICIVTSGGYKNVEDGIDTLVHYGSGGTGKNKERCDQVLDKGNLALQRSLTRKMRLGLYGASKILLVRLARSTCMMVSIKYTHHGPSIWKMARSVSSTGCNVNLDIFPP